MNILHISTMRHWGGGEIQLFNLLKGSARYSPNDNLVVLCVENSMIDTNFSKLNHIKLHAVRMAFRFDIKFILEINKLCQKYDIDIIHLHESHALTLCTLARFFYKKLPTLIYSKKTSFPVRKRYSILNKYNQDYLQKIICVSQKTKDIVRAGVERPDRVVTIYDCIYDNEDEMQKNSLTELVKLDDGCIVIGHIANHNEAKDILLLPKIANKLTNEYERKDIYFVQIGKQGKCTKEFFKLIKEYRLEEHFKVLGFVRDASTYISDFNILLMTSKIEEIPITLHEAMINRVPIVTTNAGGIAELVESEKNGLVSKTGDYNTFRLLSTHAK